MPQCLFSRACIFPAGELGYCTCHQQLMDEAERFNKTLPAAAVEIREDNVQKLTQRVSWRNKGERENARNAAIKRLFSQGWPRKRLEQVFEIEEEELLAILQIRKAELATVV